MAKGKRQDLPPLVPSEGSVFPKEPEDEEGSTAEPEVLPVGLKELDPKEAALRDGWTQRADGAWGNNREFVIPGGVVPQGVIRNTEEAYALEVQRRG